MDKEKIIKTLVDKPLFLEDKNYLVDRSNELNFLNSLIKYQPYGIFGLCGETGIGKTTILNMVESKEIKIIKVSIINRENKDAILFDLLYKISVELLNDKKTTLKKLAEEARNWVVEEVSIIKGFNLGFSLFASGSGKIEKQKLPRFNSFGAREKLKKLIKTITKNYGKTLLIIDELDKESKQDVLNVLDSLKFEFEQDNLIALFSLPYSIYREYRKDRMKWNESGNLENIIKDVVFLNELSDSDIKELLLRRLEDLIKWFKPNTLDPIILFADGNPRDALWIAQKVAFDNIDENLLTLQKCEISISKILKEYMKDLPLTKIQKNAIKVSRDFMGSKEELIELLQKNGVKRTTSYSTLDRLIKLGLIIERDGLYRISGKAKIYITLI